MKRIALATTNKGKMAELSPTLARLGWESVGMEALGLPEPEETGGSFEANARLKALAASKGSGLMALADDSGLCLPALGGWPGVDTALWTKRGRAGLSEINRRLQPQGDYRAESVCVLALAWPEGRVEIFEGRVPGTWVWPPRGDGGFGYDPVFVPASDERQRTYAEMGREEKSALSHRYKAFTAMIQAGILDHL